MKVINCMGMECPKPVIVTKKELEAVSCGSIKVVVDNEAAKENVSKLARSMKCEISTLEVKDGFEISITKAGNAENTLGSTDETSANCSEPQINAGRFIILAGNDKMGQGSDELGSILMRGYFYTLTELDSMPEAVLCVNSGVNLTCEGSESLEYLIDLESRGVEIISCGTCLDYYGLKDRLRVGNIGNMYTIAEKINGSYNTVRI